MQLQREQSERSEQAKRAKRAKRAAAPRPRQTLGIFGGGSHGPRGSLFPRAFGMGLQRPSAPADLRVFGGGPHSPRGSLFLQAFGMGLQMPAGLWHGPAEACMPRRSLQAQAWAAEVLYFRRPLPALAGTWRRSFARCARFAPCALLCSFRSLLSLARFARFLRSRG